MTTTHIRADHLNTLVWIIGPPHPMWLDMIVGFIGMVWASSHLLKWLRRNEGKGNEVVK